MTMAKEPFLVNRCRSFGMTKSLIPRTGSHVRPIFSQIFFSWSLHGMWDRNVRMACRWESSIVPKLWHCCEDSFNKSDHEPFCENTLEPSTRCKTCILTKRGENRFHSAPCFNNEGACVNVWVAVGLKRADTRAFGGTPALQNVSTDKEDACVGNSFLLPKI